MFDRVSKIINKWDPVNLFPMAPEDEYSWEVNEIIKVLEGKVGIGVNELGDEINRIFIHSFSEAIFTRTINQCREVAGKILVGIR